MQIADHVLRKTATSETGVGWESANSWLRIDWAEVEWQGMEEG
jgi:hypothetical protein